jgi:hypothetical protein
MSAEQESYFFSFTCDNCTYRGNRDHDSNYVSSVRVDDHGVRYKQWSESDRYPERCTSCATSAKRYNRMKKRLDKVWQISYELGDQRYSRPKMITFALPSIVTFDSSPDSELRKLKSLLPQARTILLENGVLGGIYVPEVTTRSSSFMGTRVYKHHAHIHMVAVAPFVHKKHLKSFCECLLPLGLGRLNYVAPSDKNWRTAKQKVAGYIAKYLNKDGRRTSSFGIYRGWESSQSAK